MLKIFMKQDDTPPLIYKDYFWTSFLLFANNDLLQYPRSD